VFSVVDWPLKVMEEERNLGSVETLHLEWQLYHVVLQMQRTYKHERWFDVTRPSVDLALATENVFYDENRHYFFNLVSQYCDIIYGHITFEHDATKEIIWLKWLYMLDRMASKSDPVAFPLASTLLYGDDQWLPGREQWTCLQPPWDLPCGVSWKELAYGPEVESRLDQIEAFLQSFFLEEVEDEYSDFLTMLMGWILCPNKEFPPNGGDWTGPPLESSEEARTCRLWIMLSHLQDVIYRDQIFVPGQETADLLEILRWACRLQDAVAGHRDLGQPWLEYLGVRNSV
jgi:hypothetical protein